MNRDKIQSFMYKMSEFRHQNNGMPITFEQRMYIYKTYGMLISNHTSHNNKSLRICKDVLSNIEKEMKISLKYKLLYLWYKITR